MSVKEGIACLIGRRVTAVVVAEPPSGAQRRVFLVLDDGFSYELYGNDLHSCSTPRLGGVGETMALADARGWKVTLLKGCAAESAASGPARPS